MKSFVILPLVVAGSMLFQMPTATAQDKKKKPAAKPAATKTIITPKATGGNIKVDATFKKIKGVAYKIVKDVPGKTAEIGGGIEFHLVAKCDTLLLGDTRVQNAGKPVTAPVMEVKDLGQFQSIFPMLSKGDSVLVVISCDTILKTVPPGNEGQLPPWLKSGNAVNVYLSVVSVKSKAEMEKEAAAAKAAQETAAKEAEANAGKQVGIDDKLIQDYIAKNNIKATKTASGLYYTITQEGTGPQITSGQKVSMRYTGKLLDGKVFDSNMGNDKPVFTFPVGQHQVIAGWDEGVALLKKGTKATFYIISSLGYGARGAGAAIGPNAVLLFDVEVVDIVSEK